MRAREVQQEAADGSLHPHADLLVHDRDCIYSPAVDGALHSMGLHVLKTPVMAPQANDYASYCTSFV
jgi:hypothetical protein